MALKSQRPSGKGARLRSSGLSSRLGKTTGAKQSPALSLDEQFDAIIKEAIEKASKVSCSIQEYVDGLEQMIGELSVSIQASEEDLRRDRT